MQKGKIVVIGSLNYDVFLKMERLPQIGETLGAENEVMKAFGGKGANQAIACARLTSEAQSVEVEMLGQVGDDQEGKSYLGYLDENKVGHSNIITKGDGCPTGQAYILSMTKTGDNSIIIVGGANQAYSQEYQLPESWAVSLKSASILLMQREIPEQVNIEAAKFVKEQGGITILDMGGKDDPISKDLLNLVDYLSPNETELQRIFTVLEGEQTIPNLLKTFPNLKLLLKKGSEGSELVKNGSDNISVPAMDFGAHPNLKLVDTTGAGDAFTGAFAVGMLELGQEKEAMELATKTAFLTISRYGAGPAMPLRSEIQGLN